jgi:hypothetical protein
VLHEGLAAQARDTERTREPSPKPIRPLGDNRDKEDQALKPLRPLIPKLDRQSHRTTLVVLHCHEIGGTVVNRLDCCEELPGVYSTIWCLCYKTNKLKKKRNRRRGAGPVYIG